ncbi:unnamed protein product [Allacma fusca]|uniref:Uncharacterized protein n=1 Tax=Allacma fusca TaxID=39272 RepID=A0A8J2PB08_9HEXA|nr:unnamed protein product [Allacma fusca]
MPAALIIASVEASLVVSATVTEISLESRNTAERQEQQNQQREQQEQQDEQRQELQEQQQQQQEQQKEPENQQQPLEPILDASTKFDEVLEQFWEVEQLNITGSTEIEKHFDNINEEQPEQVLQDGEIVDAQIKRADTKQMASERRDFDKFLMATTVKIEGSNTNMDHLYEDSGFQQMYKDFRIKAFAIRDAQVMSCNWNDWDDDECVVVSPGGTPLAEN